MIDENLPEGPGKLEFKPDEKRLVRLARFRRLVLLVTILLLGGTLLLTIMIQPRWVMVGVGVQPETALSNNESRGSEPPVSDIPKVKEISQREQINSTILMTAQTIDSSGRTALAMWQRAEMLVLGGVLERDGAEEVLKRVAMARMVNDSARILLSRAKGELERLQTIIKSSSVKDLGLNAFLAAGKDYLTLVEDESKDRQAWLDAYEASVRAFAGGDKAEYEIKTNVAGAYLRKSEVRKRKLTRAGSLLRESRKTLEMRR
ncbi:MAG: hypothetical protein K6T77_04680 [candidate division WOR-3 bacterium]|nr:hypothetical protein [candidate division WOR-3 bacterium]